MERPRSNTKRWIAALIALSAVLLLAAAALLLIGGAGLSGRYYDAAAILAGRDESAAPAVVSEGDGRIGVRMNRDDVYWYADRYGLLGELAEDMAQRGVSAGGFRISDGKLTVYARCRVLGGLPLSFRSVMALRWEDALVLTAESVTLGRGVSLPESRWPALFREEWTIPLERISPYIVGARLEGEALVLTHEGLGSTVPDTLPVERGTLDTMDLFGLPYTDDAALGELLLSLEGDLIPVARAREICYAEDDPLAATARLLSFVDQSVLQSLWTDADAFTREVLAQPLLRSVGEVRRVREDALLSEQARYEKLLSAVRESCKSGGLILDETGFVSASTGASLDTGALTNLSGALDCRVLFLYSASDENALSTADMPPSGELPRTGKNVLAGALDGETAYDLGVTLTTEAGVPVLLYRRGDGAFVLRQISRDDYVALLVASSVPVLDIDTLTPPAAVYEGGAGEGWSGGAIMLLGGEDAA